MTNTEAAVTFAALFGPVALTGWARRRYDLGWFTVLAMWLALNCIAMGIRVVAFAESDADYASGERMVVAGFWLGVGLVAAWAIRKHERAAISMESGEVVAGAARPSVPADGHDDRQQSGITISRDAWAPFTLALVFAVAVFFWGLTQSQRADTAELRLLEVERQRDDFAACLDRYIGREACGY
ncbi:MAG: hypothetical protein NXI30_04405 [bacterium]|nr:hypothetical protein [bacterium]